MAIYQQFLLNELECFICNEFMYPPIRQCVTGHSMCNLCFEKVRTCPTCRGALSNSRNFSLENIQSQTEIPCRYRPGGCEVTTYGSEIKVHQEYCQFGIFECPLKQSTNCKWTGTYKALLEHAEANHELHSNVKNGDVVRMNNFSIGNGISSCYQMVKVDEAVFRYCLWYDKTHHSKVQWAVQYFGKDHDAAKYAFVLDFIDQRGAQRLQIASTCDVYAPITFPRDACINISYETLKRFCGEDKSLNFRFKIIPTADLKGPL